MPRLISLVRDPKTEQLVKVEIAASPGDSSITLEVDALESIRLTMNQVKHPMWKPNEVVIDGVLAVRALRDACILFLDRFHDEE